MIVVTQKTDWLTIIILVGLFFMVVAYYITYSLPLYKILKKIHFKAAWMAWVPILQIIAILLVSDYNADNRIILYDNISTNRAVLFMAYIGVIIMALYFESFLLLLVSRIILIFLIRDFFAMLMGIDYLDLKMLGLGLACSIVGIVQIVLLWVYLIKGFRYEEYKSYFSRKTKWSKNLG